MLPSTCVSVIGYARTWIGPSLLCRCVRLLIMACLRRKFLDTVGSLDDSFKDHSEPYTRVSMGALFVHVEESLHELHKGQKVARGIPNTHSRADCESTGLTTDLRPILVSLTVTWTERQLSSLNRSSFF